MAVLLVSHRFNAAHGSELAAQTQEHRSMLELLPLPADRETRLLNEVRKGQT